MVSLRPQTGPPELGSHAYLNFYYLMVSVRLDLMPLYLYTIMATFEFICSSMWMIFWLPTTTFSLFPSSYPHLIMNLHSKTSFLSRHWGNFHLSWFAPHLSQRLYIINLLTKVNLQNCKLVLTLSSITVVLSKHDGTPLANPSEYRQVVGALQYLIVTRPNIAFVVNKACTHWCPLDCC